MAGWLKVEWLLKLQFKQYHNNNLTIQQLNNLTNKPGPLRWCRKYTGFAAAGNFVAVPGYKMIDFIAERYWNKPEIGKQTQWKVEMACNMQGGFRSKV